MPSNQNKLKAVRIEVSGKVQGVGFRAAVCKFAKKYQILGSVKNQPDGRVEIFAQGALGELEKFSDAVKEDIWPAMVEKMVTYPMPLKELSDFVVEY